MYHKLRAGILILLLGVIACQAPSEKNASALLWSVTDSLYSSSLPAGQQIKLALMADSLALSLKRDSLHLSLQKEIAVLYFNAGDMEHAKQYFLNAATIARKNHDMKSAAICLNNVGLTFDELYSTDSAIKYYTAANHIFYELKDSLHYAQGMINIGTLYKNAGQYTHAINADIEAIKILETMNRPGDMCDALTAIGNCMKALSRLDASLHYHQKALQISLAAHDSVGAAGCWNNIGNTYRYKKDYALALESYQSALTLKWKIGKKKSIATTLDNMAETYLEQKLYIKAQAYFVKALAMHRSAADNDGTLTTLHRLSRLMLETNDITAAGSYARQASALLPKVGYLKQRLDNTLLLTDIYRKSGQYEAALDNALLSARIKDSLFSKNMSQAVSEAETKYRTKETTQQLQFANQLKKQQSRRIGLQRNYIIVLVILVALLLIVSSLALRLSRKHRQEREKVEILMSELNHRVTNSLQVIISILQLQVYSVDEAAQKSLLESTLNRVYSILSLHELLQKQSYTGSIHMRSFIEALLMNITRTFDDKAFLITITITDQVRLKTDLAIPAGLIVNEWITNLFKYGVPTTETNMLEIALAVHDQKYRLRISDNCRPWNPQVKARKGLGLYLIGELAEQLNGTYSIIHEDTGNMLDVLF